MRGLCALAVCAGTGLVVAICCAVTPAEQIEAAPDEDARAELPLTAAARCQPAETPRDGKLLARWLERLDARRSDGARCLVLNQLAAHAAVGDAAIGVLAKYTRATYPTRVRACALSSLGFAVSPVAVGTLLELARAIEGPLREALVRALASREETSARAGLVALARDPGSPLRDLAAIALAQVGAPEAVSVLEELLQDPGPRASRLILALGETGDPKALGVLQHLLDRHGSMFAEDISSALGELSTPESTRALLSLLQKGVVDEDVIYRALAKSGDASAQQALLAAAESGKGSALATLSSLEGPQVQAWMLRALDSGDSARLQAAASYFSGHADEAAIASLSKLLRSDRPEHAQAALQALGNIGGRAACAALEELAGRPGPLQGMALGSLAQQPEAAERARALALSLLDQDEAPTNALGILAKDASPEAHAALLRAARGGETQSRRAIWLLSKRSDPETVSVLSDIARSPSSPRRLSALSALAEGGSPQAVDVMRDALRSDDPAVRQQAVAHYGSLDAPDVEQALVHASRDSEAEVATTALEGLAELATPAAVDQLARVASDPAGSVAHSALMSLAQAAPERTTAVVDTLLQVKGSGGLQAALGAVSALPSEVGERVLSRALGSADGEMLGQALNYLQEGGAESSPFVDALDRIAHDAHLPSELRDQARNLLIPPEEEIVLASDQ